MKLDDIIDTQPKTRKMRNAIKHKKLASVVKALSQDKQNSDKHYSGNRQMGVGDYNDEGDFDSADNGNNMGQM